MPRPIEESRFRRILAQGIMWVILGATIGAAALVNQVKHRSLNVVLGEPRKFEGFTIRLPKGWETSDLSTDESDVIAVEDPHVGDVLIISVPSSLSNLINSFGRRDLGTPIGDVSIGGQKSKLMFSLIPSGGDEPQASRLRAFRALDSGRILTISLVSPIVARRSDLKALDHEIDLIKQVAASVQLENSPATKPQSE